MAASNTGYLAHFLVAFEMESICMSQKLNERQNVFIKIFLDVLEKGGRGRNKTSYYILLLNQITSAPKKEVEKPWVGPNTGSFSSW